MNGYTKRSRRLARAHWGIDLAGMDKRQQRRLLRRMGTGRGSRGWFVMIDEFALMAPPWQPLWDLMPEREFSESNA